MPDIFITTPIYYANDAPHLGHVYTTVIADALARWNRIKNEGAVFLSVGTDEHGTKIERAAAALDRTPTEHVDLTSSVFRRTWDSLDISYDRFIRTTEPDHIEVVRSVLQRIYDRGWIARGIYEGPYCVACESFYRETEVLDGHCPIHRRPVERLREANWFFRLSAFEDRLRSLYENHPEIIQPPNRRQEVLGILQQGLDDVSITRSNLSWGVPVPWDETQVFYVWYDALISYLTVAGVAAPTEGNLELMRWPPIHIIGKDILRFHCIYWPALLLAAEINLPQRLLIHGLMLLSGSKMSKTGLTGLSPASQVAEVGVDGLRYHLLCDFRLGSDADYCREALIDRFNTDLANGYGNTVARVLALLHLKATDAIFESVPASNLGTVVEPRVDAARAAWDAMDPARAISETAAVIHAIARYLEEHQPWNACRGPLTDEVLHAALEGLRLATILLAPAIPHKAQEVWTRLGLRGRVGEVAAASSLVWGASGFDAPPVPDRSPIFPRVVA